MLLKALLVGALYGLSEREEALGDRLSFRRFVGLRSEESVPDHSVLNRFRNELVRLELYELLFAELDKQLMEKGAILKRGTMLDATVIKAISRPPRGGAEPTDPDGRFTKRQGKPASSYGYQAHVGEEDRFRDSGAYPDQASGCLNTSAAFVPPKPKELDSTTPRSTSSRRWRRMFMSWNAGSSTSILALSAMKRCFIIRIE